MKSTLTFIGVEKVENIVDFTMVKRNPQRLLHLFLTHDWDILYIFDGEEMKAIVSVGDIYRWHENGRGEFVFNTNFSYVSEIDFLESKKVFDRIRTIYEVPVVNKGKMIGVIRKSEGHTSEEWELIHKGLEGIESSWKWRGRTCFLIDEIRRWKKEHNEIELYIYANPNGSIRNYLSEKQKEEYDDKARYLHSEKYDLMKHAAELGFNTEHKSLKLIQNKGYYYFDDYNSDSVNVKEKHRFTPNAKEMSHKIFFLGPCTIMGLWVSDTETIEYYIQEKINEKNLPYEIVNCGLAGPEYIETNLFVEKMKKGDKVVLSFVSWGDEGIDLLKRNFPESYKCNLLEIYSQIEDPINSWLDGEPHCNATVNKEIAERIWDDFCKDGEWILEDNVWVERKALQDYYIPYKIHNYFDEYIKEHSLCMDKSKVTGAIVMNCNPFTLGHRYLIEKAVERTDFLYIFVVEEDKSYYSFADRFEMVKRGVSDLDNVMVLPSGKFILSKDTFAQYFDKESIKDVEDMSWDIRIFGEVVAKKLGIIYRFVGEEPKDIVTKEYNETMKRILPEYGITVIEIPRVHIEDGAEVISATIVRKLVKDKNWEMVKKYCPKSTTEYLMNKAE